MQIRNTIAFLHKIYTNIMHLIVFYGALRVN